MRRDRGAESDYKETTEIGLAYRSERGGSG